MPCLKPAFGLLIFFPPLVSTCLRFLNKLLARHFVCCKSNPILENTVLFIFRNLWWSLWFSLFLYICTNCEFFCYSSVNVLLLSCVMGLQKASWVGSRSTRLLVGTWVTTSILCVCHNQAFNQTRVHWHHVVSFNMVALFYPHVY